MTAPARSPSPERPIKTSKQLLVEGRTPEIFFREWVEAIGCKEQIQVRSYNSLGELPGFLRLFTTYRDFREIVGSIAIIRDAEDSPAARAFQSVCAALRAVRLGCPDAPGAFSQGTPRTGVFVLPDCQQPGMLETLCWSVLEADPKLAPRLECVTGYLACIQKCSAEIHNEAKAKVWSYLAGRGQFDPQVGRAAQAKVWDWTSPTFQPLASFLKAL